VTYWGPVGSRQPWTWQSRKDSATPRKPRRGSHVALLEVPEVGAEHERLDEALPQVVEQYRYAPED